MLKVRRIIVEVYLVVFTSVLSAQSVSSTLLGTVNDQTASPVPGAAVQLTNESTGAVLTTQSNADGIFRYPTCRRDATPSRSPLAGSRPIPKSPSN